MAGDDESVEGQDGPLEDEGTSFVTSENEADH